MTETNNSNNNNNINNNNNNNNNNNKGIRRFVDVGCGNGLLVYLLNSEGVCGL